MIKKTLTLSLAAAFLAGITMIAPAEAQACGNKNLRGNGNFNRVFNGNGRYFNTTAAAQYRYTNGLAGMNRGGRHMKQLANREAKRQRRLARIQQNAALYNNGYNPYLNAYNNVNVNPNPYLFNNANAFANGGACGTGLPLNSFNGTGVSSLLGRVLNNF